MSALLRRIRLVHRRGEVRGALEDDFHHFRVALRHAEGKVSAIAGKALRHPYNLCPGALGQLRQLIGQPLSGDLTAVAGYSDRLKQCTHLYDLACLAIALAAEDAGARSYDVRVDDPAGDRPRAAQLRVDGRPALDWRLEGDIILSSGPFNGVSVRGAFRSYIDGADLPAETVIAATVLRRGIFISKGRFQHWGENLDAQRGGCHTLQPERIDDARLIVDSGRDFSHDPAALTRDDSDWLAVTADGFARPHGLAELDDPARP
ncbi:MAG TPA: DUF2889 domain-containing protein [Porticoccaceae bacterium]|nr:DUF2889 domain-containing protein [Porticoccaceae bacterium]